MNEESFAKEMKKIQSVISRALQKANTLAALVDLSLIHISEPTRH